MLYQVPPILGRLAAGTPCVRKQHGHPNPLLLMALRPDIRKDIDSHGRRQPIALPGLIAISWRQLAQTIDRRTCGNICRHLETERTVIRSIVINTGNFPPSFHSPAMGSGRHHLAVKSPPAAGRIIKYVNLLD